MSGLRKGKGGERWMLVPSRERWDGKMESIRDWWMGLYRRRARSLSEVELGYLGVSQMRCDDCGNDGADMAAMIAELTAKMGLSAAIGWKAAV
jgi:hypothetical protein